MPALELPRMEPIRRAAKAVLPHRTVLALENIGRRRNGFGAAPIDLSYAQLLRDAPLDRLRDVEYLEYDLLPRLGLNSEQIEQEFPEELWPSCGYGLRHWQFPRQFAPYLVKLLDLDVRSYLEIGCRHGGTFVITTEYLSRFRPLTKSVGVDLDIHPTLKPYADQRPEVQIRAMNSQLEPFRRFVAEEGPFDLVLVDGDHREEPCRHDVQTVIDTAKAVVLHDIVSAPTPGVTAVWEELQRERADEFDFYEFTGQYDEHTARTGATWLGIGLAVRR